VTFSKTEMDVNVQEGAAYSTCSTVFQQQGRSKPRSTSESDNAVSATEFINNKKLQKKAV